MPAPAQFYIPLSAIGEQRPSRSRLGPACSRGLGRAFVYPAHYEVRHVSDNGGIPWHCRWVNVSQTLGGEVLGFIEIDDGELDVYFGPVRLGRFHERTLQIEDALGRQHRRHY